MSATFSAAWSSAEPLMRGLKLGGLMNQALEQDDTFRQGRHHFMTAVNQILEWTLALEQIKNCFQAANVHYSLIGWNVATFVVPVGVAYLASRQIQTLHISEAANFVQNHLGKLGLVALAVSTVALFVLGQTLLATTTLVYLSVGLLDRYNVLPESAQRIVQQANFYIGNFTGLYLGGNWIRLICISNLVIAAVEQYFEYKRLAEEKEATISLTTEQQDVVEEDVVEENEKGEVGTPISLAELGELTNQSECGVNRAHIRAKPLPEVNEDVQIEEILDLCEEIDWSKHEHVVRGKLAKDKRWLEVGQFEAEPLEYFKRNLRHMIESIKNREILEGKPASYEMLEFYCRYIAQELKEKDEMTQADILIWMGVEGGEYCGTGKFGVIEECYESLLAQAAGLPLKTRILACEQQERQRTWQNIYHLAWKMNPILQIFGYFSDINAIHNANVFINLVQAGHKFGIPHQAAKNDQTATINPVTHYVAFSIVNLVEECFWEGYSLPQCYFVVEEPEGEAWWKAWDWVHLKMHREAPVPYDQEAILDRLEATIGSPQIPKTDIYIWWQQWVERQDDLTDQEKEELCDELQAVPPTFNGEPFEVDDKIQRKFLIAMLIEMGIFDKPENLLLDDMDIEKEILNGEAMVG